METRREPIFRETRRTAIFDAIKQDIGLGVLVDAMYEVHEKMEKPLYVFTALLWLKAQLQLKKMEGWERQTRKLHAVWRIFFYTKPEDRKAEFQKYELAKLGALKKHQRTLIIALMALRRKSKRLSHFDKKPLTAMLRVDDFAHARKMRRESATLLGLRGYYTLEWRWVTKVDLEYLSQGARAAASAAALATERSELDTDDVPAEILKYELQLAYVHADTALKEAQDEWNTDNVLVPKPTAWWQRPATKPGQMSLRF
jgi:hypothetical protein